MSSIVTIVDYGMGNLKSVCNAFHYLGVITEISSCPEIISRAENLILPGVGSFRLAMNTLVRLDLDKAIYECVKIRKRKILGICLGMQLMGLSSTEDGITNGLGLIPLCVDRFDDKPMRKIPHIGFNSVSPSFNSKLLSNLPENPDFYFVHSYRMLPDLVVDQTSLCTYGEDFVAAYEESNIMATQFHPEKSQTNGLRLLKNFLTS